MNTEILEKIIQDGSLIRTQIGIGGWENSIIISHKGDIIQVNLVPEYYKMAVMAGDIIKCKYYSNGKEYLFEGEIERVTIYGVPSIFVKVKSIDTFRNKREADRLDVRLGANMKFHGESRSVYCIIDNISANGLGLISRAELNVGSKAALDILIDAANILTVRGQIVRQRRIKDYFEIGFEVSKEDIFGLDNLKETVYSYEQSNKKLVEETLEQVNKDSKVIQKNQTVMIVDDNESTRLITKKLISSQGYSKILEVTDGPQAVSLAEKLKPEIIILDILLPTLSGTEVVEQLYKVSPFSKIIIVSTISNRKIIEDVKAIGVIDYLIKPFDGKQLVEILNKVGGEDNNENF